MSLTEDPEFKGEQNVCKVEFEQNVCRGRVGLETAEQEDVMFWDTQLFLQDPWEVSPPLGSLP